MRVGNVLLGLCLSIPLIQAAELVSGSVKVLQGQVVIVRGGESLPCSEGMHIQTKDVLRTGVDGRVGVTLHDGTRISLGPNTEVGIDQFVYEPSEGQFGLILRIVHGVAAYVSGKIAQFSPDAVQVQTPVGVIGLRGTEFAISIEP